MASQVRRLNFAYENVKPEVVFPKASQTTAIYIFVKCYLCGTTCYVRQISPFVLKGILVCNCEKPTCRVKVDKPKDENVAREIIGRNQSHRTARKSENNIKIQFCKKLCGLMYIFRTEEKSVNG